MKLSLITVAIVCFCFVGKIQPSNEKRLTIDVAQANAFYAKKIQRSDLVTFMVKKPKAKEPRPFFYISSDDDSDVEPAMKKMNLNQSEKGEASDDDHDESLVIYAAEQTDKRETSTHRLVPRLHLKTCKKD